MGRERERDAQCFENQKPIATVFGIVAPHDNWLVQVTST